MQVKGEALKARDRHTADCEPEKKTPSARLERLPLTQELERILGALDKIQWNKRLAGKIH